MHTMVDNKRSLFKYGLRFGQYEIVTAQASQGDVLRIIDGINPTKKGIFIADTVEHDTITAKPLVSLLDDAISSGWGLNGDSETEVLNLTGMIQRQQNPKEYAGICFCYVQLGVNGISIVNGGLPVPLIMRKNGSTQLIDISGLYLDSFATYHTSPHESRLADGDILFLRTDGVDEGLIMAMGTVTEGKKRLEDVLRNNRDQSASEIMNVLLSELGTHFLPKSETDDDATLAVIKCGT